MPRPLPQARTVFEARSPLSGRVRVIDVRRERRLVVGGDTLSVHPLDGDWRRVEREYWWHALTAVPLPARPRVLFVGLGGGTQLHLLRRLTWPAAIAVIERDPLIVQVALRWFGLAAIPGVEYLCDEAERVLRWLAGVGRRFDFVMEDVAYADVPERAIALARAVVPVVEPGGVLVINRHRRADAGRVTEAVRPLFHDLRLRRVRREGENVLICGVSRRA